MHVWTTRRRRRGGDSLVASSSISFNKFAYISKIYISVIPSSLSLRDYISIYTGLCKYLSIHSSLNQGLLLLGSILLHLFSLTQESCCSRIVYNTLLVGWSRELDTLPLSLLYHPSKLPSQTFFLLWGY